MAITINRNITRWVIITASFIIISLILWNTYSFFQKFKAEERTKMKTWSFAYSEFSKNLFDINSDVNEVASRILLDSTNTIPMLFLDSVGKLNNIRNIDTLKSKNPSLLLDKLKLKFEQENNPLILKAQDKIIGTLYYGNSPLLNKLKYYPLALLLIILLFAGVVYFFYKSTKTADQNKLWTGMAKETAHQIGTPLSSLIGWTEILKSENVNPEYIKEMEKDVDRLQTITERFSKIGSIPKLEKLDIVNETKNAYEYLKSRSSKLIDFEISAPNSEVFVNLNHQLYSWTIENLVKNAIDAMKGKGQLKVEIIKAEKFIKIKISDTGKGIPKAQFSKVFEPGFTSKKRGWGLGLSLAKRIIEDYHNGKIKVLNSEINKGTTMQISLKII